MRKRIKRTIQGPVLQTNYWQRKQVPTPKSDIISKHYPDATVVSSTEPPVQQLMGNVKYNNADPSRFHNLAYYLYIFLMLLLAVPTTGSAQRMGETFATTQGYVLPSQFHNSRSLPSFADSVCVSVTYGPDPTQYEVCHISLVDRYVYLTIANMELYYESSNVREEYCEITGVRAIHFTTEGPTECWDEATYSNAKYIRAFSYYERPISGTFYLVYRDPCSGIEVKFGDKGLVRASKYGTASLNKGKKKS